MGVFHALYTLQLSDKHVKALKDMSLNGVYIIIGMEDQCVGNKNKNETHI